MALLFLSCKQISRCYSRHNLTKLVLVSSRTLNISTPQHFPRGFKVKESVEDEDDAENWQQFMARGDRAWDQEAKINTRFGSVRVDSDNVALYHGQSEELEQDDLPEKEKVEENETGVGEFKYFKSNPKSDGNGELLDALFEEQPNPQFFNLKEFVVNKKIQGESKPFITREHSKENLTIPIDFDKGHTKDFTHEFTNNSDNDKVQKYKDPHTNNEVGDLNYFDGVAFGEAFKSFSSEDSKKEHSVKFDPKILDSVRRQLSEEDLNEIDKEFFGKSEDLNEIDKEFFGKSEDADDKKNMVENTTSLNVNKPADVQSDLNFIDEQFFAVSSSQNENLSRKEQPTLSPFDIGNENKEPPTLTPFDIENSKGEKKKSKSKEEKKQKNKTVAVSEPSPLPDNIDENNKKSKSRKETPSPALDYVRKLRKSTTSDKKMKDPSDLIGVNLQERLNAVTLVNQPNIKTKDKHESDNDLENDQYLPVTRFCPPDIDHYMSAELEELLLSKIIYDDHDIVALWKPYGLAMFTTEQDSVSNRKVSSFHSVEKYLPKLAAKLNCEKLHEVHRLDRTTTGVLLLARTEQRRKHLKELFAKRKISKTYFALVNGTPQPHQGIINIPISEGKIGDRFRKTLRPDYAKSSIITNKKNYKGNVSTAATDYSTLGSHGSASLVECKMLSGAKHQIRIHLGLGLGTPVLGDHKYSYVDQLGKPQRVAGDIVSRLKVKRSRTRDLPIFLHARSIHIPEIFPERDLMINAKLPHFFSKALRRLKIKNAFD